jgi:hypothetical protein
MLSPVSGKIHDFNKSMKWLVKNKLIINHLLGNSYPVKEWKLAFKEAYKGEGNKIFTHFG